MKKRRYICTAKLCNIQMLVEYWILYIIYNAIVIFYSSASKWNCGIVPRPSEVGSRGGFPNWLDSDSTRRTALEGLPRLLQFRLVPASMALCRASWRGDRASSGQLDRDRGVSREYYRRVEEPSELGRLRHGGRCQLPASRTHDRVVLRLVEHLRVRSSSRAGPAYGGHHRPATAVACHRQASAACDANYNYRREFTREGHSGREGISRCRHFSTRARKKSGTVDAPATLAANPRKSLRTFSFRAVNCPRPRASRPADATFGREIFEFSRAPQRQPPDLG